MRGLVTVLLLLGLLPLQPQALGEEGAPKKPPRPAPTKQYLNAFRAEDQDALNALVRKQAGRHWTVADALLAGYALSVTKEPDRKKDYLPCLRDLGKRIEALTGDARLSAWVEPWAEAGHEELERYLTLRSVSLRIENAVGSGSFESVLAMAEQLELEPPHVLSIAEFQIHHYTGIAAERLGRHDLALDRFALAGKHAERLGWCVGLKIAWSSAASTARKHLDLGQRTQVIQEGLGALEGLGCEAFVPRFQGALLESLIRSGSPSDALLTARDILKKAQRRQDALIAAWALAVQATALLRLGRGGEADEIIDRVMRMVRGPSLSRHGSHLVGILAHVQAECGRYQDALHLYDVALHLKARVSDRTVILIDQASMFRRLGLFDSAIKSHEAALRLARQEGDRNTESIVLGNIGNVWLAQEKYAEARTALQQALEMKEQLGARHSAADTRYNLAIVEMRTAPSGKEAGAQAQAALQSFRKLGRWQGVARAQRLLALHAAATGNTSEALALQQVALTALTQRGIRSDITAQLHTEMAKQYAALGRSQEARASAQGAIDSLLLQTHGLGDLDARTLRRRTRQAAEIGLHAAWDLQEQADSRSNGARSAFQFIEASRAGILLDSVRDPGRLLRAKLPPELLATGLATRRRLGQARRAALAVDTRGPASERDVRHAKKALDDAWSERRTVLARMQRLASHTATGLHHQPSDLASAQASLAPDEAAVLYFIGERGSWAVVVRHDGIGFHRLKGSESLAGDVDRFMALVSTPGAADDVVAQTLYDRLVRPLEPDLEHARRLLISPDGPLAFLPFGALLDDAGPGESKQRLVQRWEFVMIPSVGVRAQLSGRSSATGSEVLLVGAPLATDTPSGEASPDPGRRGNPGGLGYLPGTRAELEAIARLVTREEATLLTGSAATVERVCAELGKGERHLRVVHLACHSLVDPARPELCGLVLADLGVLDVDRIGGLRVRADLVVLSACATATGTEAKGEGVLGLVRAFFVAGATRVIASNWPVSDHHTTTLMTRLYSSHIRRGQTPVAALRSAQLEYVRGAPETRHPYYWASFSLWGAP